ncbi:OmpA family protein [Alteromonas macleodii]|jgi:OOP family OmpA-OmpF porin|uniref:Flagellar motor protein MotB n=3 Tax=root TaxID=1 RepID=A0A126Q407_ALTMA|nr:MULTISPECIES: OmpA family protein [Alteromonas]MAC09424.1 flagellar motor protein MotB [Alteromonas sp.]MEC7082364.1 OmpA family protein [Pseudomonadota bacterium]NKX20509.1 OmpA family protein [Alteromonadaceae bacterium A_SAG2]PTT90984.1 flagellar motor protein MotB [Pseudomonas sp. HMWF031]AFS39065.1 OmpA/MotB protein [Alteromonas macleodii ATCC 27126]|tara:strand:+ start:2411 stop:3607 length:1197 start_codon:yes stop_codon:yes gene_type:complete
MKQHFKMAALSLAVISSTNAFAQDSSEPEYKNWFGLSGMYYNTDDSRPLDLTDGGLYDDGRGVAFEYGFRFTQSWAARVEFTALDLDYAGGGDESGEMVGVDALYFMPNDAWFVFGGVKRQAVGESTTLGNIGIGKHWDIHEDVKLVTEIAAYHDFGEDYNDYSVKVGIAIPFGKGTPAAPKDSDNDGVVDSKDQCPMTPAGVRVDANGCSIDDDNDGVLNNVDQCPNTPAGTKVDATGCAIKDSDNDGVVDSKDMCPDTPAGVKVDAKGCTVFDEETVEITLRVLFDNESAVVKMPKDPEISEFAEFMKQYPSTTAVIEGHTSAPGSEAYNMDLSKRRAANFKEVMVDMYGIEGSRLETIGYGETQLLDNGKNAEAHRVNRRISVTVKDTVKVAEEK